MLTTSDTKIVFGSFAPVGSSILAASLNYGLQIPVPEGYEVKIAADLKSSGVTFNRGKIVLPKKGYCVVLISIDTDFAEVKVRRPTQALLVGVYAENQSILKNNPELDALLEVAVAHLTEGSELAKLVSLFDDESNNVVKQVIQYFTTRLNTIDWEKFAAELEDLAKDYEHLLPQGDEEAVTS